VPEFRIYKCDLKVISTVSKASRTKRSFVFSGGNGHCRPNGCGKSNVVDAVNGSASKGKEQCGRMTDVIFSGNASRKPAGCQGQLFLANTKGRAGRLPIDADEVQITRAYTRAATANTA
jgi:hypothetical protein